MGQNTASSQPRLTETRVQETRVEPQARPNPSVVGTGSPVGCAGRETQLAQLVELMAAAEAGHGSIAFVTGPAGIGKTRLLSELRGRVRLQGGVVLEGRAEPGRTFAPFVEIVERALRFLDEVGRVGTFDLSGLQCRSGCHRFWHQHAGEEIPKLSADKASLVEEVRDEGAPPEIAAFERRMRFFDAVADVLREVSKVRAPVVLVHNLERADRGSLELLQFLLEGVAPPFASVVREGALPALFVASVRTASVAAGGRDEVTGPNAEALETLQKSPLARRILLGALDPDGVRAYLQSEDTIARILSRTGGHPDLIDLLLEADPLTPEARVERRLARLAAPARALVHALAVLGRPSSLETLARVAGIAPDVAARADLGPDLLARSLHDGGVVLSFERESDRDVSYTLVSERVRREMHARAVDACADALELEDAVRHAIATGDLDRASGLALAAAASLAARHAHAEAAILLERLANAMGDEAPLLIHEELADLYRIAGSYRPALVHATRVRAARPDDPEASRRVGHLLTVAGELEAARVELESARDVAQRGGMPGPLAEVEAQLAELSYQRGAYADARRWATTALERARTSEGIRIEIHARNTLGKLALAQKDPAAAATLFEENRALAARSGLGHQEAQAWTNLGVALLLRRDLGRAEEACRKAVEVATRASDTRDRAIATENLAVIAHLGRDYRRALASYHVAVGLLKRLGNRPMLARVAINLGELYRSLGDRAQARSLSDLAGHVLGATPPAPREAERLLLRGRVEASDHRIDEARGALERALRIFAELGDTRTADVLIELGRLAVADGDVAGSRALLSRLPVEDSPKRAADVALLRAEVERAAGGDSLGASRRAVELAERADDEELLLPALVGYGRALIEAGDFQGAMHVIERARGVEHSLSQNVPDESAACWAERPVRTELVSLSARMETSWASAPTTSSGSFAPPTPPNGLVRPAILSTRPAVPQRERSERWSRRYPSIVGRSVLIQNVLGVLDKVAASDTTVLIRGESGTGKELVAEAIHTNSARASKPLVKVNCAALVESLLLSELFGHEKGAFTGAQARRKGRFELADGGTLFLDEIGDISPKTQVALLRVLQEREFERVGGVQAIHVDVRIVCATHRDLEKMVKEGTFREDLYYRLRGVSIEVPSLRKRPEDLPVLCERLLGRIADERHEPPKRIADDAVELLARHRWPGNVRELENVLRSATLFAEGEVLNRSDFAAFEASFEPQAAAPAVVTASDAPIETLVYEKVRGGTASLFEMKKQLERECIVRALAETGGNITRAASLLGMKRPRLSQLVKEFGLGEGQD